MFSTFYKFNDPSFAWNIEFESWTHVHNHRSIIQDTVLNARGAVRLITTLGSSLVSQRYRGWDCVTVIQLAEAQISNFVLLRMIISRKLFRLDFDSLHELWLSPSVCGTDTSKSELERSKLNFRSLSMVTLVKLGLLWIFLESDFKFFRG